MTNHKLEDRLRRVQQSFQGLTSHLDALIALNQASRTSGDEIARLEAAKALSARGESLAGGALQSS